MTCEQTAAFLCSGCDDTYAPHFLEPDGTGRCRKCAARERGVCIWSDQHPEHMSVHPCSYLAVEQPGEPCCHCGAPTPDDGPCRTCWQRFDEMPFADAKAIFVADGHLELGVPYPAPPEQGQ